MRIVPFKIEDKDEAKRLMFSLGVSNEGINILSSKVIPAAFLIQNIRSWEANIIKQHLLSLGSDCALDRRALVKNITTSAFVFGSASQLEKLCDKLKNQPFGLKEVSRQLKACLDNIFKKEFVFRCRKTELKINKPLICGIINITPDSFSGDGLIGKWQIANGRLQDVVLRKVREMLKYGARIIDLGGESTRPFSKPIKEDEEIRRVIPALKALRKEFKGLLISVDTYKYNVAKAAIDEGADIINDITALRNSPAIASLLKKHTIGCVLMHTKGMPSVMQKAPRYKNATAEIMDFFEARLAFCQDEGIKKEQVFIDPGIGFGKRISDNLEILKGLYKFRKFGVPIFIGVSRKSFIGTILNEPDTSERLAGSIAASLTVVKNGASIIRAHDVKEVSQALKIMQAISRSEKQ
ncbi:MAG: dihydropteroate synthase [Candidatus Omnitrophica bacterium]|nr:dihydropteroate synthase [Candidatus Omnitrophota bacterium]